MVIICHDQLISVILTNNNILVFLQTFFFSFKTNNHACLDNQRDQYTYISSQLFSVKGN